MRFFDRKRELADLAEVRARSERVAEMVRANSLFIDEGRAVLVEGYEMLRKLILRDYNVFSGQALEDYFRHQYAESGRWTRIGSWWDRKGENEIDLLCENELDGTYCIGEVKRDKGRIVNRSLADKLSAFRRATGKWRSVDPVFISLSLEDM